MYVGYGNCSAIIHLIAKHPVGALGIGILALATSLTSPVGPGSYLGSEDILKAQDEQVIERYRDDPERPRIQSLADAATLAFEEVKDTPLSDRALSEIFKLCKCKNVTRETLTEKDPELMNKLKYLYFLDLVRHNGINQARLLYRRRE